MSQLDGRTAEVVVSHDNFEQIIIFLYVGQGAKGECKRRNETEKLFKKVSPFFLINVIFVVLWFAASSLCAAMQIYFLIILFLFSRGDQNTS